jgi:hypothetical protein
MVTLHSTESEVVGMTDFLQRDIWRRRCVSFIITISKETIGHTIVYQDNQSFISLMDTGSRPIHRTRHLNVRYFWMHELQNDGIFIVKFCRTKNMLADINTKAKQGIALITLWKRVTGEIT